VAEHGAAGVGDGGQLARPGAAGYVAVGHGLDLAVVGDGAGDLLGLPGQAAKAVPAVAGEHVLNTIDKVEHFAQAPAAGVGVAGGVAGFTGQVVAQLGDQGLAAAGAVGDARGAAQGVKPLGGGVCFMFNLEKNPQLLKHGAIPVVLVIREPWIRMTHAKRTKTCPVKLVASHQTYELVEAGSVNRHFNRQVKTVGCARDRFNCSNALQPSEEVIFIQLAVKAVWFRYTQLSSGFFHCRLGRSFL